ncbi:MAG: phosphoadenylyl-sulfate reductase [Caulobacterales bacterium]|nr:phosphoadenylyl-sulfate reductase [Caulobacterales bacterium]
MALAATLPMDADAFAANETTSAQVIRLNARWRELQAAHVLQIALTEEFRGRIAVVSSFGAESAVLLHLVAQMDRHAPVLFLETGMHFPETAEHRDRLAQRLGLTDVRLITPDRDQRAAEDPDDSLHQRDTEACCALRKVRPLSHALGGFDAWVTGRKRFQSATRLNLPIFEEDRDGRVKVNPLANWSREDLETYLDDHDLPRHPLVAAGYPSIGCAVCTSPVRQGEDERAGRWRGEEKTECGIHITADGRIERAAPA